MATTYTVRELSYAYIVEWGHRERALVLVRDEQLQHVHCLHCDGSGCDHARRVIHHLREIDE